MEYRFRQYQSLQTLHETRISSINLLVPNAHTFLIMPALRGKRKRKDDNRSFPWYTLFANHDARGHTQSAPKQNCAGDSVNGHM